METPDFSYTELVNQQIFSFIRKVKNDRTLAEGIIYLATLASQGSDKKFDLSDGNTAQKLEEDGRSFGLVHGGGENDGKVQGAIQKNLRSFFSDKSNMSIVLEGEHDPITNKIIKDLFEKAENNKNFASSQITELSYDAERKRGIERKVEREEFYKKAMADKLFRFVINKEEISPIAIRYLASLAIKGEVVTEVVGMPVGNIKVRGISPKDPHLKNAEIIGKLNEKAKEMGIVSVAKDKVFATSEMQEHLTNFLLGDVMNSGYLGGMSMNGIGSSHYDYVKHKLNDKDYNRNLQR